MLNSTSQKIFITDNEEGITYYLQAVVRSDLTTQNQITEYTTTEGTSMSDHSYKMPNVCSIELMDSNLNTTSNNIYYLDTNQKQVKLSLEESKNLLFGWSEKAIRLTIQTRQKRLTNMLIKSITWSEDNSNKDIFSPTIQFQEARVASLQTIMMGPFSDASTKADNSSETSTGSNDGVTFTDMLGGAAGGAVVVGMIGGPWGALIGGVIGFVGSLL